MEEQVSQTSIAEAAARRTQSMRAQESPAQRLKDHERRQKFRRLIDPGIMRPNSKEQAMASMNTLLKVAQNLVNEPNNPKFQQFKSTNRTILRDLVNPKGALEYAIEMGFQPEVRDFQPYYVHNPRRMEELEIGATILKEFLHLENEKMEREARAKNDAKLVAEAAALKVKMAFIDDRTSVALRDQLERQQRTAREASAGSPPISSMSPLPEQSQASEGASRISGDPPPYSDVDSP